MKIFVLLGMFLLGVAVGWSAAFVMLLRAYAGF